MDNKIQQLAEKIYKDGVEKANGEAGKILTDAQVKHDEIVNGAKKEAESLLANAQREAQAMKDRAEAEIKTSVTNAREALKSEITNLLTNQSVETGVSDAFKKPEVLQEVVLKMAEKMISDGGNGATISTEDAQSLEAFFQAKASSLLQKGLQIKEVNGLKRSFEIAPKDGGYKMNVSEEAFVEYFKDFLRPRMRELLYGADKK